MKSQNTHVLKAGRKYNGPAIDIYYIPSLITQTPIQPSFDRPLVAAGPCSSITYPQDDNNNPKIFSACSHFERISRLFFFLPLHFLPSQETHFCDHMSQACPKQDLPCFVLAQIFEMDKSGDLCPLKLIATSPSTLPLAFEDKESCISAKFLSLSTYFNILHEN